MPTPGELAVLRRLPGLSDQAERFERRAFAPLQNAPKIQDRKGEIVRLLKRTIGGCWTVEGVAYEANDWLMRTMQRECRRSSVRAVHAYEDCSLWQFDEAQRLGKACIYDLPIGYYPAWERIEATLVRRYSDWLPREALRSSRYVRIEQKRGEIARADLVLVPSRFVQRTVEEFEKKRIAVAAYGVDSTFWRPSGIEPGHPILRFIYAGQCSLRKGTPVLLAAWAKARLADAELMLVGTWCCAEAKKEQLPPGVRAHGPVSRESLRTLLQSADVFVFPTFFEGRALVVGEALACGKPVVVSDASGWDEEIDQNVGRVVDAGDVDQLVESLRWFGSNRDQLVRMSRAARAKAESCTWLRYRESVANAVSEFN
jgi:glycosyltransferase involved in cell wall biosynthesis